MNIFLIVFEAISPNLRKRIVNFVHSLHDDSSDPENPLDAFFITLLTKLLNIEE